MPIPTHWAVELKAIDTEGSRRKSGDWTAKVAQRSFGEVRLKRLKPMRLFIGQILEWLRSTYPSIITDQKLKVND